MKIKKLFLGALIAPLLVSCSTPSLRPEISAFMETFSIEDALESYKEAGYQMVTNVTQNGVDTCVTETFDFNVKDSLNPSYTKTTFTVIDGVETARYNEHIYKDIDTYKLSKTGVEDVEVTLQECMDLILKFFYKNVYFEGTYHEGGMFYGDSFKRNAISLQNYIVIDEENNVLDYEIKLKGYTQDGVTLDVDQHQKINNLGMLILEETSMVNSETQLTLNLTTYNI